MRATNIITRLRAAECVRRDGCATLEVGHPEGRNHSWLFSRQVRRHTALRRGCYTSWLCIQNGSKGRQPSAILPAAPMRRSQPLEYYMLTLAARLAARRQGYLREGRLP